MYVATAFPTSAGIGRRSCRPPVLLCRVSAVRRHPSRCRPELGERLRQHADPGVRAREELPGCGVLRRFARHSYPIGVQLLQQADTSADLLRSSWPPWEQSQRDSWRCLHAVGGIVKSRGAPLLYVELPEGSSNVRGAAHAAQCAAMIAGPARPSPSQSTPIEMY